jgi:hypothetical protein
VWLLLGILGAAPGFLRVRLLRRLLGYAGTNLPLRQVQFALKGVIFAAYYGDDAITRAIGFGPPAAAR